MNQFCILFEQLYHHLYGIGNLLLIIQQNLLTDNFRYEETSRLIGQRVFLKVRRRLRHQFLNPTLHIIDIEISKRRNRDNLSLRKNLFPLLHQSLQLHLIGLVYFVDKQQNRTILLLNLLKEMFILINSLNYICHIKEHIRIIQCRFREIKHGLLQLIIRLQDSRRIGIDYLHIIGIDNSHDTMTCSLRLRCNNRQTLAHQPIHQG